MRTKVNNWWTEPGVFTISMRAMVVLVALCYGAMC